LVAHEKEGRLHDKVKVKKAKGTIRVNGGGVYKPQARPNGGLKLKWKHASGDRMLLNIRKKEIGTREACVGQKGVTQMCYQTQ